jgi:SsrA-binding protein
MGSKKNNKEDSNILVRNRKALHDYHIMSNHEAGIELRGTEVKSCRARSIALNDAYVKIERGEAILYNAHIAEYEHGNRYNHNPTRPRRLLLHKREILKLSQLIKEKGYTIIPLKMYLCRGKIKVDLGIAKGKKLYDKRESLKQRQDSLDSKRAMSTYK